MKNCELKLVKNETSLVHVKSVLLLMNVGYIVFLENRGRD